MDSKSELEQVLRSDPDLVAELVRDPVALLARLGFEADDLACNSEAHAALDRAERAEQLAAGVEQLSVPDAITTMGRIATEVLEPGFSVRKVPFGIEFAEAVADRGDDLTGTATIKGTFRVRIKGDFDG